MIILVIKVYANPHTIQLATPPQHDGCMLGPKNEIKGKEDTLTTDQICLHSYVYTIYTMGRMSSIVVMSEMYYGNIYHFCLAALFIQLLIFLYRINHEFIMVF